MLAFLVINVDAGSEKSLIRSLRKFDYVRETSSVIGTYDIVAKVEVQNKEELDRHLSDIRQLRIVRNVLALRSKQMLTN